MLLSAGLFDRDGFSYRTASFTALRLPFLLDDRGPAASLEQARRAVSDHLPILLTLDVALVDRRRGPRSLESRAPTL